MGTKTGMGTEKEKENFGDGETGCECCLRCITLPGDQGHISQNYSNTQVEGKVEGIAEEEQPEEEEEEG